jgi:hypothetical protein
MSSVQSESTVQGLTLLSASSSSIPPESVTYKGKWYDLIDHNANLRCGIKSSPIWQFGCDYIDRTNLQDHCWRCNRCQELYSIPKNGSPSTTQRYLYRKYQIDVKDNGEIKEPPVTKRVKI